MWRNSIISALLGVLSFASLGQYGNEWIDFSQTYYKFKIADADFYRITSEDLQAAGFPVTTVSPDRIQLFREGEEVALNVVRNQDDNLLSYIEFYGYGKDGTTDSPLYNSGDQPHTFYNLFTDSASYFLTFLQGSGNGKRMEFSADRNATGLTPEPYHLEKDLQLFNAAYHTGERFGQGSAFSLSIYGDGEGWTDSFLGKNGSRDYQFTLTDLQNDVNPRFETVVVGGNSLNHNVDFSAGPDVSNLDSIANAQFIGFGDLYISSEIPQSSIGAGGELNIRMFVEGFPNAADRASIAYLQVTYPQEVSMAPDENKVFELDNVTGRRAWLQIATTNPDNTSIYNITDPANAVRMAATTDFSDRVELVVPDVSTGSRLVAVTAPRSVGEISPVSLPDYDLSSTDYLVITHPLLRESGDPVNDFEVYRESVAGGGHSVQTANIDDIYNLFGFGDPTPLAITNFIRYANNQNPVNNVLIIGKGLTVNFDYYRGTQSNLNIPTYGFPGTDLMYTLGLNSSRAVLPGIPIGRLNATTTDQVSAYLDKLIEMEGLPFDDLFRKDFLQLSGGINQNEISSFRNIVDGFTNVVETDFIGGRAFNAGKQTSESVEFIDVSSRVNEGVGYITFFGHSSGSVTDIEIGRVSNPEFRFDNKGKYPIFLVNGCAAGEIFGGSFTFGEDWILTPDLGALGFIAHTNTALASTLRNWSNTFYDTGFGDEQFIGSTIGELIIEVSDRYVQRYGSGDLNLTQVRQMQLQGDPAYRLFGADFPDYHIDQNAVTASAIGAEEILATQDTFKLDIVISNFGRTLQDSVVVQVDRVFADGSSQSYLNQYPRTLRLDTIEFKIPNDPTRINEGTNLLTVNIDPANDIEEMDESNNSTTIEISIFNGNTLNLFPVNNGTQASNVVEFMWQSTNLLEESRDYELEFDTQADFSGANRQLVNVTGEVLLRHFFDFSNLSLPDTATIYWRTRFATPGPDESSEWIESSFTLIDNVQSGWGQYQEGQLDSDLVTGIEFNEVTDEWEFIQTTNSIDIFTFGADNTTFVQGDVHAIVGTIDFFLTLNPFDACENNTLSAMVFNVESGDPYTPIPITGSDVLNREVCGRLPQRIYQFREVDLNGAERRLQVLSDFMRDGDNIVLFNVGNVAYSSWDSEVIATMESFGISSATIASLTDGQPVIFLGRKGDAPGTATAVTSNGSSTPVTEQDISIQTDVFGSFISGTIQSERIGPASSWESFSYAIEEETNDSFTLDLLGVTPDGQVETLVSRARTETIDVGTIDAIQYPELELVYEFEDQTDQTPPQLNFWEVNYTYPPEGLLVSSSRDLLRFREGEQISRGFQFINVSSSDFTDSLTVMARLINQDNGTVAESSFRIAPPSAGDTTAFEASFSSFDRSGLNSLILQVQASENEIYTLNNNLTLANLIEVQPDETNPILDVTFDGFHILDGDVVSTNPNISVRMRDDNPFAAKTDTTGINLSLRLPGDGSQFERINFTDPRLTYTPATESQDFELEFQPGPLDDGIYGLRVQAEDETGNQAGAEPFEITFEVINESTITHFYPYPNPFSTSCRFVFTLTGSEIPDQIKIQIMTVSGRVVREITQDEIGPVRIGNNITSYAWDGRDEFGDQLANGVYFYKVFTNVNGNEINLRSTVADKAFKNGFGKLYILR